MTLKAREFKGREKEGKRKASPECGFASRDRYSAVSRSGSRYMLATHRHSGADIRARNASRKFIRSRLPSPASPAAFAAEEELAASSSSRLTFLPFSLLCFAVSPVTPRGTSTGGEGRDEKNRWLVQWARAPHRRGKGKKFPRFSGEAHTRAYNRCAIEI